VSEWMNVHSLTHVSTQKARNERADCREITL
jgi:hypothetical protein